MEFADPTCSGRYSLPTSDMSQKLPKKTSKKYSFCVLSGSQTWLAGKSQLLTIEFNDFPSYKARVWRFSSGLSCLMTPGGCFFVSSLGTIHFPWGLSLASEGFSVWTCLMFRDLACHELILGLLGDDWDGGWLGNWDAFRDGDHWDLYKVGPLDTTR